MLLFVAVRRYIRLLTPRAVALVGRTPDTPILLLVARAVVLCGAAPPSSSGLEGRVVEPMPLIDGLLVAALYGLFRPRTAALVDVAEAPPLVLLQHLSLALHRRIHRHNLERGVAAPRRRTSTLLNLVCLLATRFWRRFFASRATALGGRLIAIPASLLRHLKRAARPDAALQGGVVVVNDLLLMALRRWISSLAPRVAALGGPVIVPPAPFLHRLQVALNSNSRLVRQVLLLQRQVFLTSFGRVHRS